ncbi:MAG TPA: putative LPS assembly protein LptD [Chitinispirillaceae bacterium]|nr:putative LPS assembly protein LptD [Chitinispirillaceae bacterium]
MFFSHRLTPLWIICFFLAFQLFTAFTYSQTTPDSAAGDVIGEKTEADSTSRKKNEITDTVFYEAETIFYDNEEKILTLTGKANVRYQKMQLLSDTIIYTINDNLFTASGYPQLVESSDTTIGDYMVYNIKTRRGRVRHASTNLTDGSFNGRRIIKSEKNEVYVDEGDYTTCEHIEDPHFFFYGKKIKLIPQDRIISKPVVLNIGNTPVAVLPFFMFPLDRDRRSGFLTPVWGGHPTSGGYIDNIGYYYAGNDYIDLLARGKVSDFRRYEFEAATQYRLRYKFDGNLRFRYSLDKDFLAGGNQWTADYSHNQTLTPDGLTRLAGSGRLTSSNKYFFNNSEDSTELVDQELNANMSLSRTLEKINGSANLTWSRDHNLKTNIVNEDLPSVSFNIQQRPLVKAPDSLKVEDVPWYSKIYYGYNARGLVKHIDSTRVKGKEHFRPGMSHSLAVSSPQKLFRHIDISPSFNADQFIVYGYSDTFIRGIDTLYDTTTYKKIGKNSKDRSYPEYTYDSIFDTLSRDDYGNPDTIEVKRIRRKIEPQYNNYEKMAHIEDWRAGLSVGTTLYGLFPLKFLNLMGIRHTFKPLLNYSYNPKLDNDKRYYPGGIAPPGARKRQQVLSISAGNNLEGKFLSKEKTEGDSKGKTVSLLNFNVGTGYDFEKKHRKWSDLSLSASSSIEKIGLNVGYNSAFWLYDQNDQLTVPTMRSMSLDFRTSALSAKGTLWDGNMRGLDSTDTLSKGKSGNGMLEWNGSLSPSFTYSMDRVKPTDMFVPKKQFNLSGSASLNFTKSWSLRWSGSYNFQQNQWVNNSFDLNCDLECWEMRFNWRPEKLNPGYYFLINIKKIPEIKWEQRQNQ